MDFDYPFHIDGRGRTACSGSDHLRDLIEQLLFTSPGERVNRPDFGCGLAQMVFDPNGPEVAAALKFTVLAALQRWLGDVVEVDSLDVTANDAQLKVEIAYRPRGTNDRRVAELNRPVAP